MTTLGVVGTGTMGSGIAQVAAQQGLDVVLVDAQPELARNARDRIEASLQQAVQRGRLTDEDAIGALQHLRPGQGMDDLAAANWVIEAVPEEISLKRAVFAQLEEACPAGTLLATNTSSLSVSEIAAASQDPQRVVGLHFFNPVPAMALVEVVRGSATSETTLQAALALARELGKTPVAVADCPGFIVNRVVRPFYNEALRMLSEGVAQPAEIDRAMRGVGFRMGPFELMDLIGNDVNLAVTTSIYEQFFGEPRFRPSPLQRRLVQSGALGRKTGRGWYDYSSEQPESPVAPVGRGLVPRRTNGGEQGYSSVNPQAPALNPQPSVLGPRLTVIHDGPIGAELADALQAGTGPTPFGNAFRTGVAMEDVDVLVDATTGPPEAKRAIIEQIERAAPSGPLILSFALTASTTEIASWCRQPRRVCGFGYLPPLGESQVLEIAPGLQTGASARAAADKLCVALGKQPVLVQDGAGLAAARIVSLIINEAAWALMEQVASPADVDLAVRLGANYPRGPLEWADRLGLDLVLHVIEGLQRELGDDRYRPAPLLRKLALAHQQFRAP